MPDRIIGATALALDLELVTSDKELRASIVPTIW
jgi:predicted nucleic acid-binding protein